MLNHAPLLYPHKELHKVPADLSKFWVITIISNACRFKRRYELYWRFAEMCHDAGVNLITVEQAFGDRQFMVTESNNKYHLQVRSVEELWHKENMINMGVKHACAMFPGQVREVAWVDADCRPMCTYRDWFENTWHELQHYEFVQMWEWLLDLDYSHNPLGPPQPGFMANYIKYGTPNPKEFHRLQMKSKSYPEAGSALFGRPGLAWACNRDAFNKVGGLIDFCVLGAGDYYMAHALVGTMSTATNEYVRGSKNSRYAEKLFEWQDKALRWIKKDVGYVKTGVLHDFHGSKVNRRYGTRGKILINNKYNPDTDLKYDCHGMLQLETWSKRQMKLRDDIRAYFRQRNEDEIS